MKTTHQLLARASFWTEPRTIIALALSVMALAEIIDLTIVAVCLPHMMGALNANLDEISLVLTSYIVAAAVFIPLTGFATGKFGLKRSALVSICLFGCASILCGLATSVTAMVIFRLLQGIGGAFLPALAQGYIADNFQEPQRTKMTTLFTTLAVLGPIIGPILGGGIAENLSWRWIFYINVPICLLAFIIVKTLAQDSIIKPLKTDVSSFIFMALGFGLLEYFIDVGNGENWFETSNLIIIFWAAILAIAFFIWRGLLGTAIVDFRMFKSRNFVICCIAVWWLLVVYLGALNYFPTLLQQGYGFPVDLAGYITVPRGIAASIAGPICLRLAKKIDPRLIMSGSILLIAYGNYILSTLAEIYSLKLIILAAFMQGAGLMGVFLNLVLLAYVGLPKDLNSGATGVFFFFRNMGNSIGSSIAASLIARQEQISWHDLTGQISSQAINYLNWSANLASGAKLPLAALELQRQAFFIANLDLYHYTMLGSLLLLIVPWLLKMPKQDFKG